MSSEFDVSIVIPTLRAEQDLVECLESIASQTDAPSNEVVIVLNNKDTENLNLKEHHPNSRVVVNNENLGFAKACNIGAVESVGGTLVFINDDMIAQPGWLAGMVNPIIDGQCSVTGGRILSEDGKNIDFDGSSINLLGWGFQKGHTDSVSKESDEFASKSNIPFACGGNLAIKAELFEQSGGFDDDYFAYYEDVDLGWRLALMGESVKYCRDAVAYHYAGSTGVMMAPQTKWFLQERNALQNVIKNYSDDLLAKILPVAMALISVRAQILSDLESRDVFPDKFWQDAILGKDFTMPGKESGSLLKGLVAGVKDTIKSKAKQSRQTSMPDGFTSIDNRGVAGLFALEWCMNNWDHIMAKRQGVQSLRKKYDSTIINGFEDPMRPVTGHPREVEAMKPLEKILNEIMI